MDYSLPASSVRGNLQEKILGWVASPFSEDLPDPGMEPGFPTWQADPLCLCQGPLIKCDSVLYLDTETQWEHNVKTEAEARVIHPQAKKSKHCLQPSGARRQAGLILPQSPQKEQANTLILDPSLQFVVICDLGSSRTLIYDHFFHSWIWRLPGLQAVLTLGPSRVTGRMAETGVISKRSLSTCLTPGQGRLKQLGMDELGVLRHL